MKLRRLLAAAALAVALPFSGHAQSAAVARTTAAGTPPTGQVAELKPAAFTVEQQKEFLKTAKVIGAKTTSKGVTRPSRLTLSNGDLTHDASFQMIDERKTVATFAGRSELNFRDFWGYNIAAHELACLIGRCELVPAAVQRDYRGDTGSYVWWVDNVMMDEGDRVKKRQNPPNVYRWTRQMQMMRMFTALTADTDRNQTNILITDDWRVVLIDFSRAFRLGTDIKNPAALAAIDRDVFDAMKAMTREQLKERASDWLTDPEIDSVMDRRDALVAHYTALAAEKGDAAVFYPKPAPAPSKP